MGILEELLAGGQRQKEYSDFIERYEKGHKRPVGQAWKVRRSIAFRSATTTTRLFVCRGDALPVTHDR